mmetsp:Transcript_42269/g.89900  ORF Transcript_42269/g.89900 Transcript_42269/m.89900 type:complete len:295 (+) Transcript_42269:107-991(+)
MDLTNQIQDILVRAGNYIHGRDSEDAGVTYTSIVEWKEGSGMISSTSPEGTRQQNDETRRQWYETGYDFWEDESNCAATVDGVLGGFACISKRDLEGSADFVRYLKSNIRPELNLTEEENGGVPTRACECGAGIGRVSKGLLLPLGITQCDLVEPSPRLISSAPEYLGDRYSSKCRFFCTGLQDFQPKADFYDIIWIQWVIGYLTDDDLVDFLERCAAGLRLGGVVVIKDNTCEDVAFVADRSDASVTRSFPYILAIAERAGLRVVYQRFQEDFPESIFPVPIIAMEPKARKCH